MPTAARFKENRDMVIFKIDFKDDATGVIIPARTVKIPHGQVECDGMVLYLIDYKDKDGKLKDVLVPESVLLLYVGPEGSEKNDMQKLDVRTDFKKNVVVRLNNRTGIAECSKKDKFDLAKGFEIALTRASGKTYYEPGMTLYVANPNSIKEPVTGFRYNGGLTDEIEEWDKRGILYAYKEDAIAAAKAMIKTAKKWRKNHE